MTTISHICFEPSDVQGIQLECRGCETTISLKLNTWKSDSVKCPNCLSKLAEKGSDAWLALEGLIKALNSFADADKTGFRVRLQFKQS